MKRRLLTAAIAFACAVSLAQWSEPVNLSRTPGTHAWYPSLTVDPSGTLYACWSQRMANMADWIDFVCKPAGVAPGLLLGTSAETRSRCGVRSSSLDRATCRTWSGYRKPRRATSMPAARMATPGPSLRAYRAGAAGARASGRTPTGSAIAGPDVAVDRPGRPHVLYAPPYFPEDTFSCAYAWRTDTGWTQPSYVPSLHQNRGRDRRIAVDTSGQPRRHGRFDDGDSLRVAGRQAVPCRRPASLDTSAAHVRPEGVYRIATGEGGGGQSAGALSLDIVSAGPNPARG